MKIKVLIIEDNEQNLYLTTFLLSKYGFEVLQAREGRTGIEIALRATPDIILVDIQLPAMDGYAVTRILRASPGLKAIPIVAVTSYAMPGDRETAMAAGCTGYIEKPINPDTFVAEVRRYLAVSPATEGGES
jgi:two-component system, cell cycle response regulator DivK